MKGWLPIRLRSDRQYAPRLVAIRRVPSRRHPRQPNLRRNCRPTSAVLSENAQARTHRAVPLSIRPYARRLPRDGADLAPPKATPRWVPTALSFNHSICLVPVLEVTPAGWADTLIVGSCRRRKVAVLYAMFDQHVRRHRITNSPTDALCEGLSDL